MPNSRWHLVVAGCGGGAHGTEPDMRLQIRRRSRPCGTPDMSVRKSDMAPLIITQRCCGLSSVPSRMPIQVNTDSISPRWWLRLCARRAGCDLHAGAGVLLHCHARPCGHGWHFQLPQQQGAKSEMEGARNL